jgi:hypothetical protein
MLNELSLKANGQVLYDLYVLLFQFVRTYMVLLNIFFYHNLLLFNTYLLFCHHLSKV